MCIVPKAAHLRKLSFSLHIQMVYSTMALDFKPQHPCDWSAACYIRWGTPDMRRMTVTSWWARWRLKSPASRLFTQRFVKAQCSLIIGTGCWVQVFSFNWKSGVVMMSTLSYLTTHWVDHSGYGLSESEEALHSNASSHWHRSYPECSLCLSTWAM